MAQTGLYAFGLDAAALTAGTTWQVCTDLDGVNGSQPLGPTSLRVYVRPANKQGQARGNALR